MTTPHDNNSNGKTNDVDSSSDKRSGSRTDDVMESGSDSTRKRKSSGGVKGQEVSESRVEDIETHIQQAISQTWVVPDGGYGWVVMLCSLMISVIVDGVTYTFGVFLRNLEEAFQEPKSTITLANSIQVGFYLISGPVVSALTNRYGCRAVVIVGTIVTSVSFVLSALSPNISVLIFTYGAMGGVGFGMMYLPSVVAVSIFFDKKRALATGIAVCGSGIGTFVLAPLTEILLEEYGWRWTLVLLGGIIFHGVLCGALIRPLEIRLDEKSARIVDIQLNGDVNIERVDTTSVSSSNTRTNFRLKNRLEVPESIPLITITDDFDHTLVIPTGNDPKKDRNKTSDTRKKPDPKFFSSTPVFPSVTSSSQHAQSTDAIHKRKKAGSLTENEISGILVNSRQRSNTITMAGNRDTKLTTRARSHTPIGLAFIGVSDMYINKIRDDVALPLSRRDINRSMAHMEFGDMAAGSGAGGDVVRFGSEESMTGSMMSRDGGYRKEKGLWSCLPSSARETLEEMMNLGIFKERRYWFVIAGNFMCMVGFYVPFVYIPGKATELGVSDEKAAFLISVIGITNLIGRVATGVLVNYLPIEPVPVTAVALGIGGIVTMACPLCETYGTLMALAAIFGLCVAAYISLCSILLCELLGVRNLTNAFGYVILFRGIACIMGPPIAGALIDSTGMFDPAFYVGGGMIVLGSLCHFLLLLPCIKSLTSS